MSAEILWGIDPTIKRAWTPAYLPNGEESGFRIPPAGWNERLKEIAPKDEDLKDPAVLEAFREGLKALSREFAGMPRGIKEGAPVVWLSPLSEQLSQELQAARSLYQRQLFWAKERLAKACAKVRASEATEEAKDAEIERLEQEATDANVLRGEQAYSPELRSKVLGACIVGFDRFKRPFSGKWIEDSKVIPAEWKAAIFLDLVDGSAWTETEVEGFTWGQASPRD